MPASVVYMFPDELMQTLAGPLMVGTGWGMIETASAGEDVPTPHTLVPKTVMFPDTAVPE
jgi:hypothetical protein